MPPPPTSKTIRLPSGLTLPYLDQGRPAGPTIVLLHGITDSCLSFRDVMGHLPAEVRAIAPSQRGHGDAGAPESYRLEDFADDLASFLDALSLERVILVGHSMGAAVAQRFAVERPDRVQELVLVSAFAALARNAACVAFAETIAALTDPVDSEFVRAFQESTLARPLPSALMDEIVSESLKVPARVWKAAWSGLLRDDLTPDMPRISAPTLLVWGNRDDMALRDEQAILLRTIPRARLVTFAGAGHAPHWEEPARFAALLLETVNAAAA